MRKAIAFFFLAAACSAGAAFAQDNNFDQGNIKRVLLISIDGMHAVDYVNCVNGISTVNNGDPYCPALAELGMTGINYVAASTSKPSDSFPGLTAIVTGGSPALTGVYYDVAYSRNYDAPAKTTGNGLAMGPCTPYATPKGTTTEYEEGIDYDKTKLNGGAVGASLTDGGLNSIDPKKLVRDPNNGCNPVFPWQFVRTNSIFSVVHRLGGYAAWSDKHPAYASVASGIGPIALDDFYAPEINSTVVALPAVQTPTGLSCTTIPDPGSDLTAWTNSFQNIQCYDTLKVDAIVNEIDGKDHLGLKKTQVPNLFGMNFQAVSVGQKLIEASNSTTGGYLDAAGTPTDALLSEIKFVDASIGKFVKRLKAKGLYDSTLIVITAKHGQSPIDSSRYVSQLINGTSPVTLLSNAGYIPFSESTNNPTGIGPTEDDVSLVWLRKSSDTDASVKILEDNAGPSGIALGTDLFPWSVTCTELQRTTAQWIRAPPDIIVAIRMSASPTLAALQSWRSTRRVRPRRYQCNVAALQLLLQATHCPRRRWDRPGGSHHPQGARHQPSELYAVRAQGTSVLPAVQFQ